MTRRFAVVLDHPSGPFFLGSEDDGLPLVFPTWEEAEDRAASQDLSWYLIVRLPDGSTD